MGATGGPRHTGKVERDPVEGDLVWAAHLLLRNCYRLASDQHEVDHPTLAQAVRNIVGDQQWHDDSNGSLIRVLRDAIARVPEELNGRRPEYPPDKVDTSSKWYGKPERRMAAVLYGVGSNLPDRRYPDGTEVPRNYGAYYRPVAFEAASLDGLNDGDKNRVTHVIRQDLAAALRAMEQATLLRHQQATEHTAQAEPVEPQPGDISRQYINRPEYETWYTEQRERGTRIFLLHGDAGTGKTTLARHFGEISPGGTLSAADTATSAQLSMSPLIEIGTRTSAVLHDNLLRTLHRRHMDIPGQGVLVRELFRELLESPQAPGVVLLDNVEEETWDDVRDLLPDVPQSTIIITSRYRLRLPAGAAAMAVGEMTDDEAAAMVRSQLTGVSDEDASGLASDLGNRPLAIRHACGFISQEEMTVTAFRELLKQSIVTVLDNVADDEETLTTIYRLTCERLDADALRVLDLVTITGIEQISAEFLRAAWCKDQLFSLHPNSDESLEGLKFKKALRALQRRSLIDVEYVSEKRVTGMATVHPLTLELVLQLRLEPRLLLVDELHKAIENGAALTEWQPGKTLPSRLAAQALSAVAFAFRNTTAADGSEYLYDNMYKLYGAYLRARQILRHDLEDSAELVSDHINEYIEFLGNPEGPFPWNRIPIREPNRWADFLRQLIKKWRRSGTRDSAHAIEAMYQRTTGILTVPEDELVYFAALFPQAPETHNGFQTMGIPAEAMVVPYFSQGVEHHPFAHQLLRDFIRDDSQHTAAHMMTLRKQAMRAEHEGRLSEAGNVYFALGTYYFDRSDFTCAVNCYRHCRDLWVKQDSRYYAGELCKVGARVAESYSRLGKFDEAAAWRTEVSKVVESHIKLYGLDEWVFEDSTNYFLYSAMQGRVRPMPPIGHLRAQLPSEQDNEETSQEGPDKVDEPGTPQEDQDNEADDWFAEWYASRFGKHAGYVLTDRLDGLASDHTVFRTDLLLLVTRFLVAGDPHQYIEILWNEYNSPKTWPLARPKLLLLIVKTYMYMDKTDGTQNCSDDTLRDIREAARIFKEELKSPYWYADSLLTAYVLCARYDCGAPEEAQELFQELWGAHHQVGRTDRLRIALAARDKKLHFDPLWLFAELRSSSISTSSRPTTAPAAVATPQGSAAGSPTSCPAGACSCIPTVRALAHHSA